MEDRLHMISISNAENLPRVQSDSVHADQIALIKPEPSETFFTSYASSMAEKLVLLSSSLTGLSIQNPTSPLNPTTKAKESIINKTLSHCSGLASRAQGEVAKRMETASLALAMKLPSHAAYAYKLAYQSVLSCLNELLSYESVSIEGEVPAEITAAIASARSMLSSLKGRISGSMFNLCESEGCGLNRQDAEKLLSGDFQFEAQAMNLAQQKALRLLNGTLRENPEILFSKHQ